MCEDATTAKGGWLGFLKRNWEIGLILVLLGLFFGEPLFLKYREAFGSPCEKMALIAFEPSQYAELDRKILAFQRGADVSASELSEEMDRIIVQLDPTLCTGSQRIAVMRIKDDLEKAQGILKEGAIDGFFNSFDGTQRVRFRNAIQKATKSIELAVGVFE